MKIEQIEVIPANYRTNENPQRVRSFALVKITTSDGVVGWGEASDSFGHATPLTLKAFVDEKLRFVLVGQDPRRLEALMWRVRQDANRYSGFRELTMQALSAVEIALWDIRGKLAGKSVSTWAVSGDDFYTRRATLRSPLSRRLTISWFQPAFLQGVRNVKLRSATPSNGTRHSFAHGSFPPTCNDDRWQIQLRPTRPPDVAHPGRQRYLLVRRAAPDHNLGKMARLTASACHWRALLHSHERPDTQSPSFCSLITICGRRGMKIILKTMGRMAFPRRRRPRSDSPPASISLPRCPRFLAFGGTSPFQPLRMNPKDFATERIRDSRRPERTGARRQGTGHPPGIRASTHPDCSARYPPTARPGI